MKSSVCLLLSLAILALKVSIGRAFSSSLRTLTSPKHPSWRASTVANDRSTPAVMRTVACASMRDTAAGSDSRFTIGDTVDDVDILDTGTATATSTADSVTLRCWMVLRRLTRITSTAASMTNRAFSNINARNSNTGSVSVSRLRLWNRRFAAAVAVALLSWLGGASTDHRGRPEPANAILKVSPPHSTRSLPDGSLSSTGSKSPPSKSKPTARHGVPVFKHQTVNPTKSDAGTGSARRITPTTGTMTASSRISPKLRLLTGSGVLLGTLAIGVSKVLQREQQENVTNTIELQSVRNATLREAKAEAANLVRQAASSVQLDVGSQQLESLLLPSNGIDVKANLNVANEGEPSSDFATSTAVIAVPNVDDNVVVSTTTATQTTMLLETIVSTNAEVVVAAEKETVAPTLPENITDDRALPKVLKKLMQNGASKYETEETKNLSDTLLEDNASPAPTSIATMGDAAPFAYQMEDLSAVTSAAKSSSLSTAKDMISQFFFSSHNRDDTAMGGASNTMESAASVFADAPKAVKAQRSFDKRNDISIATIKARQQPKTTAEEARLQAKYAAISSLEERAFTILVDLGMVTLHNDATPALITAPLSPPPVSVTVVNDESAWA